MRVNVPVQGVEHVQEADSVYAELALPDGRVARVAVAQVAGFLLVAIDGRTTATTWRLAPVTFAVHPELESSVPEAAR